MCSSDARTRSRASRAEAIFRLATAVVAAISLGESNPVISLAAQTTSTLHGGTGGSVHVRSTWTVAGASIAIEYGRPLLKGRSLETLIPPGRVWRTGADEATILRIDRDLQFDTSRVLGGAYSLYTVPGAAEWQLIVNRQTGQWGTNYDDRQDVVRVPMTVATLPQPIEQLTISAEATTTGGTLAILWGRVRASARFSVAHEPRAAAGSITQ